jgi:hypothetical protein
LKCNLTKSKTSVFKKGGKLKKVKRWAINNKKTEAADEIRLLWNNI